MDPVMIEVPGPVRPGLRMEVSARGRLLLRQDAQPVLVARVEADHWGVAYHRTGPYRSPVPPAPAPMARAFATDPARWAYHFTRQLTASTDGPLYPVGGG
jgi:hypothetical protein